MTHAFKQTQLASRLGFQDPDRKNPRHDLACRWLAHVKEWPHKTHGEVEVPLQKGTGQYLTVVGFLDVVIAREWREPCGYCKGGGEERCANCRGGKVYPYGPGCSSCNYCRGTGRRPCSDCKGEGTEARLERCIIEVKTNKTPVGDILKQINYYRSFYDGGTWMVVVDFDITPDEQDTLTKAEVKVARLGTAFNEWATAQEKQVAEVPVL